MVGTFIQAYPRPRIEFLRVHLYTWGRPKMGWFMYYGNFMQPLKIKVKVGFSQFRSVRSLHLLLLLLLLLLHTYIVLLCCFPCCIISFLATTTANSTQFTKKTTPPTFNFVLPFSPTISLHHHNIFLLQTGHHANLLCRYDRPRG